MGLTAQMLSFNRHMALDRVGGDEDLLKELVELFLVEYPQLLQQIEQGVNEANAGLVERSAHSLKGSLSTIGAEIAANSALALELMGRTRNLDGAGERLAELQSSVGRLHLELVTMVER
jgi:HPt (histidine-containing phosphotransfer) domain-containing protein